MIGGLDCFEHVAITVDVFLYDHAERSANPYVLLDRLEMVREMGLGQIDDRTICVRLNG